MMKRKLLMAALCVVGGAFQALAQSSDVTSQYLTNADFEGEYTEYSRPRNDKGQERAIYQPAGWTVTYTNGESNDMTSLNNDCLQWSNFSGRPQPTNGGNKTYWIRFRWGNSENLVLSQTVTLPAGAYTLSADAFFNGANSGSATISAAGISKNVTGNSTWSNYEINFTLASETSVTIAFNHKQGAGVENVAGVDNFKLTYKAIVVKDGLETAITAAMKASEILDNDDLVTAIEAADEVWGNEAATQDEVNAAAATLNAATTQAASASNINSEDVTGLFLTHADLSSTEGWTDYVSDGFRDYGRGLIGDYTVRFSPATVDETHKATESCFGFECRWSTNYVSYYQTTPVPAGVYTLTYDVENVNSNTRSNTYNNLFYVEVNGEKTTDTATEWMSGGSSWTTHTIRVAVEETANMKISFGYGNFDGDANNISADNTPALYVSHVKLSYSGFLVGAKAAWDDAVAAANTAKTNNPNVTGSELTALDAELAKSEPTTVGGYNEATSALTEATTALVNAAPSYNAWAEASAINQAELDYAASDKYTAIATAQAATPSNATEAATDAAAVTTAIRAYYESHALAEGVNGAVNCTDAVADANADKNTGWTNGIGTTSGQGYTEANGEVCSKYLDGGWSNSAGVNIDMTRQVVIPAGTYLLTVTARGASALETYTLSIGDQTVNLPKDSNVGGLFGNGWSDVSVEFTTDGHPVTLEVKATSTDYYQWISLNRFRLVQLSLNEDAYADDYKALNEAIAANTKTLGFENGQYAPYKNVEALEALKAATDIDQTAELTNLKSDIATIIENLGDATWTANDGDVDAIFNGSFSSDVEGDWGLTGWTRTNGWGQQRTGISGDYETAYYNQPGSLQYGNAGVYTMPLAANTWYKLSFVYRSHENNSNKGVTASVLNEEGEGLDSYGFPENGSTSVWKTAEVGFKTGAAGNYVLTLANGGNTWMTNVSLVKAETTDVTMVVSKAQYATFVAPFDVTIPAGVDAYTISGFEDGSDKVLKLDEVDTTIPANTPVVLFSESAAQNAVNETFTGVAVYEGASLTYGWLTGVYEETQAENTWYVLQSQNGKVGFYEVLDIKPSIPAYRAYLTKPAGAKERAFFFDGDATAIEAVSAIAAGEIEAIYTTAGVQVQSLQKGMNIVVLKNGQTQKVFVK